MRDRDDEGGSPISDFVASDLGKSVIAGAAIGAVAAAILPFVGWGLGAVVGGGYGAYRKLRK